MECGLLLASVYTTLCMFMSLSLSIYTYNNCVSVWPTSRVVRGKHGVTGISYKGGHMCNFPLDVECLDWRTREKSISCLIYVPLVCK